MAAMAAALAVAVALAAFAVPAMGWAELTSGGTDYCPISKWGNGATTQGAIIDPAASQPGAVQLAHYFGLVTGVADCANMCTNWGTTAANTIAYDAIMTSDVNKPCAFWTYLDLGTVYDGVHTADCYLYSCGACVSKTTYWPGATNSGVFNGLTYTFAYTSGMNAAVEKTCTGVVGDPHFSGADNSHFDFTGVPNTTYTMVSDAHLNINMFLGGHYGQWGENPHKAMTWIRKVGVMWGHHTIAFHAREGAAWEYNNGYMSGIEVDGEKVKLAQAGDVATFANGQISIQWVAAKLRDGEDEIDVYVLTIPDVLTMRMKLRPEIAQLRTETDGTVHMGLEFPEIRLTPNAHGVLGQTYRDDHRNRLATQKLQHSELLGVDVVPGENGEGFLDGHFDNYQVSGLFKADSMVSRFTRAKAPDAETAAAVEISSGAATSSYSSSRKFLRTATAAAS